ncbi:hypothetical protein [Aminobacter sp. Piv2-1]|uniref:hypothetical protein n=1 Tax=Aminobacter sp. Piv2-1 TaxID=3031122 RepID=UPI0030985586
MSILEGYEVPTAVLVAREMEIVSNAEIIGWANNHSSVAPYTEDMAFDELRRSNPRRATDVEMAATRLAALVQQHFPDFDKNSAEAEESVRNLFLRRLQEYCVSLTPPFTVCQMVQPIEEAYNFPVWLGDLYNACDWVDHRSTLQQAPQVGEAVARILAEYGQPLSHRGD